MRACHERFWAWLRCSHCGLDWFVPDGHHFLTMELVAGRSLDHRIPASGLDAERIFAIADALAGTLAAAHDKGPSTATSSAPT